MVGFQTVDCFVNVVAIDSPAQSLEFFAYGVVAPAVQRVFSIDCVIFEIRTQDVFVVGVIIWI